MTTGVELKLRRPLSEAQRLQTLPGLSEITPQNSQLLNTYFDTPELDLRRRGIALRLRCTDQVAWLMNIESDESSVGSLARRSEWEGPTQPGDFDLMVVTDQDIREFLESRYSRLQPVFSTDFTRTAWMLKAPSPERAPEWREGDLPWPSLPGLAARRRWSFSYQHDERPS